MHVYKYEKSMTTRYSVLVSHRRTHLCELETYERGQLEVSRWPLAKGRWSASCGPRFCMGSGALSKQFGIKFTFSYFEITVCTLHTCIVDECTKLLAGAWNDWFMYESAVKYSLLETGKCSMCTRLAYSLGNKEAC